MIQVVGIVILTMLHQLSPIERLYRSDIVSRLENNTTEAYNGVKDVQRGSSALYAGAAEIQCPSKGRDHENLCYSKATNEPQEEVMAVQEPCSSRSERSVMGDKQPHARSQVMYC